MGGGGGGVGRGGGGGGGGVTVDAARLEVLLSPNSAPGDWLLRAPRVADGDKTVRGCASGARAGD